MTHRMTRYTHVYDYRDPACPWTEEWGPEDEEDLMGMMADRAVDAMLEEG